MFYSHRSPDKSLLFFNQNIFQQKTRWNSTNKKPYFSTSSHLPGTASLVEEIDKKQLVMLRDGRILIGTLRSVDQFANLVLQDTVERITVDNEFCDLPRGIYLIRGENVALMGDVDHEMEGVINNQECRYLTKMPEKYMQQKSLDKDQQNTEEQDKKLKMLRERGMTMFREMPGDQYV